MQLTVTLDDTTVTKLKTMAANRGYADVRRFVQEMLESQLVEQEPVASPALEKVILEGFASGISTESPDEVVARLRAKVLSQRPQ